MPAQEGVLWTSNEDMGLRFHEPLVPSINFTDANGWVVKLHFNPHRVEVNPNVALDDTAKLFWNTVAQVVGQPPVFPEVS